MMSPELAGDLAVNMAFLVGFFLTLIVGCIVADKVLPRIPFVQRFLDTLPKQDED